jgi:methylthioribose-1-phosphate isomerase
MLAAQWVPLRATFLCKMPARLLHGLMLQHPLLTAGARLTAFELVHDGLPATLLVDSAAAALMAQGKVDAVVVGADRVVANGDTANKIGTFSHAVAAAAHGIPFFVAAPTTTLDAGLATGEEIEIEQRPAEEITHFKGLRVVVEGIHVSRPRQQAQPAAASGSA